MVGASRSVISKCAASATLQCVQPPLAGKSLVVIGGTSGLGLSAARAFVEAGARVLVVGRDAANAERAAATLGESARAISADACDPATAPRAIAEAVAA